MEGASSVETSAARSRARRRLGRGDHRLAADDPDGALAVSAGPLRKRTCRSSPLLLLVSAAQLADLELRGRPVRRLLPAPFHPPELEARLRHLFWRAGGGTRARSSSSTASCCSTSRPTRPPSPAGRSTSPTWSTSCSSSWPSTPARSSRETLLSRVWGYEYYGGARTVDVHIRRLRAKLGEEHANLIQTVRSVGYRFGQSRWGV